MNFCKKLCVSFVEDYHVVVFLCLVAADDVCHYYLLCLNVKETKNGKMRSNDNCQKSLQLSPLKLAYFQSNSLLLSKT